MKYIKRDLASARSRLSTVARRSRGQIRGRFSPSGRNRAALGLTSLLATILARPPPLLDMLYKSGDYIIARFNKQAQSSPHNHCATDRLRDADLRTHSSSRSAPNMNPRFLHNSPKLIPVKAVI